MKKIGIMQPYFFPYIGYFSLIKHTDQFILFDPVQFIRHGWIERNRILKQGDGWLYVKAPLVKGTRDTLIKDMLLDNSQDWKGKILSQLQTYKKIAPYYDDVVALIKEVFSSEVTNIVSLDKATIEAVCRYLKIKTSISIFSEMQLKIDTPMAPDEWTLNICRALGNVNEYWNPPGGQTFFDKSKYDNAGIELKFQKTILSAYNQEREEFIAGLSIIDVLMFNSPLDVNRMLDNYEFI